MKRKHFTSDEILDHVVYNENSPPKKVNILFTFKVAIVKKKYMLMVEFFFGLQIN